MTSRLLLVDRQESRIGERVAQIITKPFQYLSPTLFTTPIETLAKAMVANTIYKRDDETPVETFENTKIFILAKMFDDKV